MVLNDCSLIATNSGRGNEYALKIYDILKNKSSRFELNELKICEFRDGEIKPKISKNVRRKHCFFIHDSIKNPSEWFTELCLVNQALSSSSALEIIDVLPYLKFSRQDRKDESRVSISSRAIASVIEKYSDRIITLDLHNPATQGCYDIPFDNLYSYFVASSYISSKYPELLENLTVMSTDAGGANRATSFAKRLGFEDVAISYKTRKKAGEIDSLRILGDIENRNVLIIDDILDSGKTLARASISARQQGAKKVYAYCTHGLFTNGLDEIVNSIDRFFIGDTVKTPKHEKIEVISFAPLFAEAIYRIAEGESLSALFD